MQKSTAWQWQWKVLISFRKNQCVLASVYLWNIDLGSAVGCIRLAPLAKDTLYLQSSAEMLRFSSLQPPISETRAATLWCNDCLPVLQFTKGVDA